MRSSAVPPQSAQNTPAVRRAAATHARNTRQQPVSEVRKHGAAMGRAPIQLRVERATVYDELNVIEVKPRLAERSIYATLPRDFRFSMPTTSVPTARKASAHTRPPLVQAVTPEPPVPLEPSVPLTAATEDDPAAVMTEPARGPSFRRNSANRSPPLFSPRKLGAAAKVGAARCQAAWRDALNTVTVSSRTSLSASRPPPVQQRVLSPELKEAGGPSSDGASEAATPSCYTSGSDNGECFGSVWVVRHGERIDAVEKGWKKTAARPHDPPLTPTGFEQAAATGRALREHRLDAIYTSPFLRCVQTATAIVEAMGPGAPPIHVEPGLGEWLFNRWFSTQPVDGEMTTAALQQAHRHHRTTAPAPPHHRTTAAPPHPLRVLLAPPQPVCAPRAPGDGLACAQHGHEPTRAVHEPTRTVHGLTHRRTAGPSTRRATSPSGIATSGAR